MQITMLMQTLEATNPDIKSQEMQNLRSSLETLTHSNCTYRIFPIIQKTAKCYPLMYYMYNPGKLMPLWER